MLQIESAEGLRSRRVPAAMVELILEYVAHGVGYFDEVYMLSRGR